MNGKVKLDTIGEEIKIKEKRFDFLEKEINKIKKCNICTVGVFIFGGIFILAIFILTEIMTALGPNHFDDTFILKNIIQDIEILRDSLSVIVGFISIIIAFSLAGISHYMNLIGKNDNKKDNYKKEAFELLEFIIINSGSTEERKKFETKLEELLKD